MAHRKDRPFHLLMAALIAATAFAWSTPAHAQSEADAGTSAADEGDAGAAPDSAATGAPSQQQPDAQQQGASDAQSPAVDQEGQSGREPGDRDGRGRERKRGGKDGKDRDGKDGKHRDRERDGDKKERRGRDDRCPEGKDCDQRRHHRGDRGPGGAPPPPGVPPCPGDPGGTGVAFGAPPMPITEILDLPDAIVIDQGFISEAQALRPRPDHAVMGSALTGYIPVFGGNVFVKPGFSAAVNGIVTSKRIGAPTWFVTSGIPVEGGAYHSSNAQFAMTANTSSVWLDIRARTPIAPVRVVFNTSFAQPDPGFGFHPNYAYAQFGGLTFGLSDSAFMDVDATPFTLDFEGPNALVSETHAVLSYAFALVRRREARLHLTISIEQPVADIRAPTGYENRFFAPDGVLALRFESGFGHVQIAGLARGLGLQTSAGRDNLYAFGYGGSLTGSLHLWRGASLVAGVTGGRGISAYINDLGGLNDDAIVDADGDLEPLLSLSAFGGLTVSWTKVLRSTLSYGYVVLDDRSHERELGGDGFRFTNYAALNLVCRPTKHMTFGIEGLFGSHKVVDGRDGMAFRGQATFAMNY